MDLSSIEQIIRTRVPNASSDNVELYLDSVDRVLSRGGDYSDMSEDDVVEDFEYYIQSRMDEIKKPTTKMKKSELKEMIKAAFIAEAEFTNDETFYDPTMEEADSPVKEKSLDDMLADIIGTEKDPYMAEDLYEAEEEEEEIEVDAEEKIEKPANDSIVVDKRIVSLSSLPSDTRKILDSLESLRAQAEEFGDQKFITQVGNTITFFTRDFVVAGDEPTKAKVDESLEILRMKKIAGLLTEGEYAKALLRETNGEPAYNNSSGLPPEIEQGQYDYEMDQYYNYRRENKTNEAESKGFNVDDYPDEDDDLIDLNKAFKATPDKLPYDKVLDIIKSYEDESILDDFKSEFPEGEDISKEDYSDFSIALIDDMSEVSYIQANWIGIFDDTVYEKAGLV